METAQAAYANAAAIGYYERALTLTEQLGEQVVIGAAAVVGLAETIGDLQTLLGNYEQARSHYQAALDGGAAQTVVARAQCI
ncbi:MAG TPA: hypothetical protein VD886_18520 [Herpetosiphonaceae bacterium]|nr:hypothetical protein [Herpetosiphonaceae bacterium]